MRVVTNRKLIKNRSRLGTWSTFLGFASLLVGAAFSFPSLWSTERDPMLFSLSWACLITGFTLTTVGRGPWLRYSVHPRPDEALAIHLKTLDSRALLLNYVSTFPVSHLLFTPAGLVVIETRPLIGDIIVKGDRWRRRRGMLAWLQLLSEGALGNPTRDALRGVELMQNWLAERLGAESAAQVRVEPMVVFTHPRVMLQIEEPSIPVALAKDTREEVRKILTGKMPGDIARKLELLLLEEARPDGEPVSAGDAVDRRPKRRRPVRAR